MANVTPWGMACYPCWPQDTVFMAFALNPTGSPYAPPENTLADGLVAWYRHDGTDQSVNGLDMAAIGTPTYGTGINGETDAAINLNPSHTFAIADLLVSAAPFSWSVWMRVVSVSDKIVIGQTDDARDGLQFGGLQVADDGSTDSPDSVQYGLSGLNDSTWHHLVATNNGSETTTYLDGVAGTPAGTGPTFVEPGATTWAGIISVGSVAKAQFLGYWNRVLTADEVAALYNAGAGFDPTA